MEGGLGRVDCRNSGVEGSLANLPPPSRTHLLGNIRLAGESAMSASPKRFAVFEAHHGTEYMQKTYGEYGKMMASLLEDPGEVWDVFSVVDGNFPLEKELDQYDGFVVTGGSSDAHGDDAWILKLCEVIRHIYARKKQILGICFGHQVLSRALGGKTGRASVGWEIGLKEIHLNKDLIHRMYGLELPPVLKVIESHQDQVSCVPPNGVILGYSAKTEIEIFAVGKCVLGIQCHPEFTEDILLDIVNVRRARGIISEVVANEAKLSFEAEETDPKVLKNFCKSFLKRLGGTEGTD